MTVSTFYPDADVETDTVDGWAEHVGDAVWDTIHDGAGTGSNDAPVSYTHLTLPTNREV